MKKVNLFKEINKENEKRHVKLKNTQFIDEMSLDKSLVADK